MGRDVLLSEIATNQCVESGTMGQEENIEPWKFQSNDRKEDCGVIDDRKVQSNNFNEDPPDWSWEVPCTLPVEYWKRTDEVAKAKALHVESLEGLPVTREELILNTTLADGRNIALEKNYFPYDTPEFIEHWTLWSRHEMNHREICEFTTKWLVENLPGVVEWNYEENVHRSFDIPHVHCFFRFRRVSKTDGTQCAPTEIPRRVSSGESAESVCNKRPLAVVSDDEGEGARCRNSKDVLRPHPLREVQKDTPNQIERSDSSSVDEENTAGPHKRQRTVGNEVSVTGMEDLTHSVGK